MKQPTTNLSLNCFLCLIMYHRSFNMRKYPKIGYVRPKYPKFVGQAILAYTVTGKVTRGKSFANFVNSVIIAKLFRQYILNSTRINSALLESRNFSISMQSRELFAKLFIRVTSPAYGSRFRRYHLLPVTITVHYPELG